MMKTLRQIADELGISKSSVYRFVKAQGIEPIQPEAVGASVPHYGDAAESRIKSHFSTAGASDNRVSDAILDAVLTQYAAILKRYETELDAKNAQIEALQNSLAAAQALHAAQVSRLPDGEAKPGFFARLFRRGQNL